MRKTECADNEKTVNLKQYQIINTRYSLNKKQRKKESIGVKVIRLFSFFMSFLAMILLKLFVIFLFLCCSIMGQKDVHFLFDFITNIPKKMENELSDNAKWEM